MIKQIYLLILLIFCSFGYSQTFIEQRQIGQFSSASAFSITPAKHFYVSDSQSNEIFKLDSTGRVLKTVGGYGWDNDSFDNPTDVYNNVLTVFVADKNNNRIQLLDKDLNYISSLTTQNSSDEKLIFRYPTSITVSNQGDIFILDSDNKRVLKFNMRGEYLLSIGGIDAGEFQLSNPLQLCLDNYNNLIVLQNDQLFVFDQFGNGLFKKTLPFAPKNINSFLDSIILIDSNSIMGFRVIAKNTYEVDIKQTQFSVDDEIVDAMVINQNLFVLCKHSIHIFNR